MANKSDEEVLHKTHVIYRSLSHENIMFNCYHQAQMLQFLKPNKLFLQNLYLNSLVQNTRVVGEDALNVEKDQMKKFYQKLKNINNHHSHVLQY